jgi:hypothetical protein
VVLGSGNRELGGGDRVELGGAEGGNEMVLGINWVCVSLLENRSNGFLGFLLCRYANGQLGLAFEYSLRKVIMGPMKHYIFERMYIVQTPSGDLLQVWREHLLPDGYDTADLASAEMLRKKTSKINLYKVHVAAKELVEINDLHDIALFLGHSQSHCLSAEAYPQLKANHVYLTDSDIMVLKSDRRDMCVFNLESSIREEIIPPQMCSWPPPIWITPHLTKLNSALGNR